MRPVRGTALRAWHACHDMVRLAALGSRTMLEGLLGGGRLAELVEALRHAEPHLRGRPEPDALPKEKRAALSHSAADATFDIYACVRMRYKTGTAALYI